MPQARHVRGQDLSRFSTAPSSYLSGKTFESQGAFRPHVECLLSKNLVIISHPSQAAASRPWAQQADTKCLFCRQNEPYKNSVREGKQILRCAELIGRVVRMCDLISQGIPPCIEIPIALVEVRPSLVNWTH